MCQSKERRFSMRNALKIALVCLLGTVFAGAQEQASTPDSSAALLKEFSRSAHIDGLTLSFVLLNDRTVDALFQAPGKYAMRARARMATTFYIQGTPEKDIQLDTKFVVEQDGETVAGTSHNIKNFADGTATKGVRIDGILQMEKKLDLAHAFKIKGSQASVEFKLTEGDLKLAEPVVPPTPAAAPPR
jgi:hypothetical protein